MSQSTLRSFAIAALVLVAFAALTVPVWRWLWGEWMGNSYYSHGVLIPPVSLFLVYQRFRHDPALSWQAGIGSNAGLVTTAVMLALYLFFLNGKAYYLAAFAMIGLIAGLTWTLGGANVVRRLAFPIGYLAFMVPLPIVERATYPLALFTGVCSTGIARIAGLPVEIVGNAVKVPNADLVIGAQCSGINSMIALTALMALAAYVLAGPTWGRIGLVAMAIPLAMAGNILRVASLLFVASFYGADAAFVFYQDYSGPVFFIVALGLMLPVTHALRCRTLRAEVI